jgi:hypothetical protein
MPENVQGPGKENLQLVNARAVRYSVFLHSHKERK